MKSILFAIGLLCNNVSAAVNGAEVYKDCVKLGDEFCDAHYGEDHPALSEGPWDYSYYHGRDWPKISLDRLKKTSPGVKVNECGGSN